MALRCLALTNHSQTGLEPCCSRLHTSRLNNTSKCQTLSVQIKLSFYFTLKVANFTVYFLCIAHAYKDVTAIYTKLPSCCSHIDVAYVAHIKSRTTRSETVVTASQKSIHQLRHHAKETLTQVYNPIQNKLNNLL